MNTQEVIALARDYLRGLAGHEFDVLEVTKPVSPEAAVNLAKIISKLSPLVGNLIEFNTCEYLNDQDGFAEFGKWQRQDPGFPDTIFTGGTVAPTPGFEIKAWFPLATEITARFKDSQNHFAEDQTYVAMLAWLPEFLIFGKPKIIDIWRKPGTSTITSRLTIWCWSRATPPRAPATFSRPTPAAISFRAHRSSSRKRKRSSRSGAGEAMPTSQRRPIKSCCAS